MQTSECCVCSILAAWWAFVSDDPWQRISYNLYVMLVLWLRCWPSPPLKPFIISPATCKQTVVASQNITDHWSNTTLRRTAAKGCQGLMTSCETRHLLRKTSNDIDNKASTCVAFSNLRPAINLQNNIKGWGNRDNKSISMERRKWTHQNTDLLRLRAHSHSCNKLVQSFRDVCFRLARHGHTALSGPLVPCRHGSWRKSK